MTDHWTARLSDYLDGDLAGSEREALEQHLFVCAECTAVLAELRQVVDAAQALAERLPTGDSWPAIVERIAVMGATPAPLATEIRRTPSAVLAKGRTREARPAGRLAFSLPQLAAAALALMVGSGGAVWLASRDGGFPGSRSDAMRVVDTRRPGGQDGSERPSGVLQVAASPVEPRYGTAISELERALAERRDSLDPQTLRVVEENLRIIDRAIEDARSALAADPADPYVSTHLAETMRRKLELLRRANGIATSQI